MSPSSEEIKAGKDALKRSATFEAREKLVKRTYIRVGLFAIPLVFCSYKLAGYGIHLLVTAVLALSPILVFAVCLEWERRVNEGTIRKLREKYGPEIDGELGVELPKSEGDS